MYYSLFRSQVGSCLGASGCDTDSNGSQASSAQSYENLPNGRFSSLQCEIALLNSWQLCTDLFGPVIFVGFYKQDQIHPP